MLDFLLNLFYKPDYNIIGVNFSNKSIILSCIKEQENAFKIIAYEEILLDLNQIYNLNIFNQADICQKINFFLEKNKLVKSNYIVLSINQETIEPDIKPEFILQCKLLFFKLNLNLIFITTSKIAQDYAQDNIKNINDNLLIANSSIFKINIEDLKIIIGLYLIGKKTL